MKHSATVSGPCVDPFIGHSWWSGPPWLQNMVYYTSVVCYKHDSTNCWAFFGSMCAGDTYITCSKEEKLRFSNSKMLVDTEGKGKFIIKDISADIGLKRQVWYRYHNIGRSLMHTTFCIQASKIQTSGKGNRSPPHLGKQEWWFTARKTCLQVWGNKRLCFCCGTRLLPWVWPIILRKRLSLTTLRAGILPRAIAPAVPGQAGLPGYFPVSW